jgi:hypothetical protein
MDAAAEIAQLAGVGRRRSVLQASPSFPQFADEVGTLVEQPFPPARRCWRGQRQYAFELDPTRCQQWRHAAIAARADHEHAAIVRGDVWRGTYAQYEPAPWWRAPTCVGEFEG